ncbi:adenylyl-sulfate kinase [Paenibacillus alvei]|uniref:Adenylyl-sulfate kinase n=1 Tax=Paenibacillus alvei TaxID=44250 RepID=A0ABT4H1B0_PAEAL|nr:adenylyl-sulfate kinase [Paenibacillus alvei]EJW15470.1 putative adenylylsulfate kinase [Paenibacillus alvei DSM 29]MCY9545166.1 adenylyl-sulfate kinase [Paenibacillus alvei]MCY9706646.1 adenylyl-sulfate kinase [Paenibacillus alvei]MCY9736616.1 adenylyl-sulfate kinase [Paenibacillus alvei]MCY9757948.1 adenylyl-sulfate kinase [Paenibacillus alvei]
MKTQLILVEGLPGSGKSTVARLVSEILAEKGIKAQLFLEGNAEHPADYDGVSFYRQDEFDQLLLDHEGCKEILESRAVKHGSDFLIPYRKMKDELGSDFPDELLQEIFAKDIYELPFDQHVRLLTEKWNFFKEDKIHRNSVHIFECCFIQNPLTIGTVKYNVQKEEVIHYVLLLEEIVKSLNPFVIYVDQKDIRSTFEKAINERPKEWSDGFIEYYTNQGFGKMQGYCGVDGTVQVLQERKSIELEIFNLLKINKQKIDNSQFDIEKCKEELKDILSVL